MPSLGTIAYRGYFLAYSQINFFKQYVMINEQAERSAPDADFRVATGTQHFTEQLVSVENLALVMKGGGVKGLAYVGALKELEKYYSFEWFIGTSAGAIAAVLLAAGYSTKELGEILSRKNFLEFLDSSVLNLPTNLFFKGGLFEARSFTTWLDKLIAAKIPSFAPLPISNLTKRATVYASRRYRRALVFDKFGPKSDTSASYAVRCSMSIPLVFVPQRDQGLRVLDGGMQNNYPVSDLLASNPDTKFIGLYLGNYYEGMPKEPSLLREMISIWTEAVDAEALEKYQRDTVIIDPRPISTIDFNLTSIEKDFLLKVGRSSALRFLLNRNLSNGPMLEEVEEAEEETRQAKSATDRIRRRRRIRRRSLLILTLVVILGAAWLVSYFGKTEKSTTSIGEEQTPKIVPSKITDQEAAATLSGTIVTVINNKERPIQGAKVALDDYPGMHAVETSSDGIFNLIEIPKKYGESVRIRVIAEGYEPNPYTEDIVLGKAPPRIHLTRKK